MSVSIIGLGKIGSAIAGAFARKGIDVVVAGRKPPDELAPLAAQIGPTVAARTLADALEADVVILAVPFGARKEIAAAARSWRGKLVVDAMNAYGVAPEELGGLPSTAALAVDLPGARVAKAFNHLPAAKLALGAESHGGRRVVFVSSDDAGASAEVAALAESLGFAPVELGKLAEGGLLVQARGSAWAQLIFKDLVVFPAGRQ